MEEYSLDKPTWAPQQSVEVTTGHLTFDSPPSDLRSSGAPGESGQSGESFLLILLPRMAYGALIH